MIEDSNLDALLMQEMLAEGCRLLFSIGSYELTIAATMTEGLKKLEDQRFQVILLDLTLPDSKGLDSISRVIETVPDIPLIVTTGNVNLELFTEAFALGAQDFLVKGDFTGEVLIRSILAAILRVRRGE